MQDSNMRWCEACGEAEQEISTSEAGLCGDCFASTVRLTLADSGLFDRAVCGHPYWYDGKLTAICVLPYGEEHLHLKLT